VNTKTYDVNIENQFCNYVTLPRYSCLRSFSYCHHRQRQPR